MYHQTNTSEESIDNLESGEQSSSSFPRAMSSHHTPGKAARRSEVQNKPMSVFEQCMSVVYGQEEQSGLFDRCMQKPQHSDQRSGDGDMGGGHVGKYVSLANPDANSRLACHVPLIVTVGGLGVSALLAVISLKAFLVWFALISVFCGLFVAHLVWGSLMGRECILHALRTDWVNEWEEFKKDRPGIEDGLLHIVVLPNYKEDEDMLSDTIENISESYLAKSNTIVVLGMEAREGPSGSEKANRLITRHKANFKDMFATFHPPNIPCEVAGKSSNTQWAFREVQRWFGSYVSHTTDIVDPSKVLVTVADADAIHHKHHWLCMSISALSMPVEQRNWTMFQPPIIQFRNLETVPALIRLQAYATIFYEVASLYTADWKTSMTFSAYTAPLQLLGHPMIDGWDADVIAEDHHMYFKCGCASYWEQINEKKSVDSISKLSLCPVWLPLSSYMAEDRAGWWPSIVAKFQQARRHAQGVSEISYLCLQKWSLCEASKDGDICPEANRHFNLNILKYFTMSIITSLQGVVMACLAAGINLYLSYEFWFGDADMKRTIWDLLTPEDWILRACMIILAAYSPILMGGLIIQTWLYACDNLCGHYTPLYKTSHPVDGKFYEIAERHVSIREKLYWLCHIAFDYLAMGFVSQMIWGAIPALMAVVGLSRNGHKFEYIVAAKPEGQSKADKKSTVVTAEPVGKGSIKNANESIDMEEFVNKNGVSGAEVSKLIS